MKNESSNQRIEGYLTELRRHLRGLSSLEIDDIANEIRSHLEEGLAESKNLSQTIKELGDPAALAGAIRAYHKSTPRTSKPVGVIRWILTLYAWISVSAVPLFAFGLLYFIGFALVIGSLGSIIFPRPDIHLYLWREVSPVYGFIFFLISGIILVAIATWLVSKSAGLYMNSMRKIRNILGAAD